MSSPTPAIPVPAAPIPPSPADSAPEPALAAFTTLRLGGPARRLVRARTADEVVDAVRAADAAGERLLVLGGGSNLVVADAGFDGTVLLLDERGHTVEPAEEGDDGWVVVRVAAGEDWDELVAATVAAGLGGLECLSGIPGSTGATPVQNVGAYGVEVADVLLDVELVDRGSGARSWVPAADLGLAYRTSRLKLPPDRAREIVLTVRFRLRADGLSAPIRYGELARALGVEPGTRVPVADAREAVLTLRRGKGMVLDADDHDTWSAGSFFTNPLVDTAVADAVARRCADAGLAPITAWPTADGARAKLSAAALIERAGVPRGHPGPGSPVRVSTRHTLALTHRGGGSTAELLALARDVRDTVRDRFGVVLVPEPVLVGCALDPEPGA